MHNIALARNIVVFVIVLAGLYVYLGNSVPQIKAESGAETVEIGTTPDQIVSAGKRIFTSDSAKCLTCHSVGEDPKARCPNMESAGASALKRKRGSSAAKYFVESVYNPNAFIVPGYPAKQMTPVNKPPITLNHDQILAAICFLNSLGGKTDEKFVAEVRAAQEPWKKGLLKPEEPVQEARIPILPGNVEEGRTIFKDKCLKCHRVGNEGFDICPDLTSIGSSQTADYLLESIVSPSAVIVKGYKETIVVFKNGSDIRGIPVKWLPEKEHPQKVILNIKKGEDYSPQEVDISDAVFVGDTTVAVEIVDEDGEEDAVFLAGELLSGDGKTELKLTLLIGGAWKEFGIIEKEGAVVSFYDFKKGKYFDLKVAPEKIAVVNLPLSPMPGSFAKELTAREIFDLISYLLSLKGKR